MGGESLSPRGRGGRGEGARSVCSCPPPSRGREWEGRASPLVGEGTEGEGARSVCSCPPPSGGREWEVGASPLVEEGAGSEKRLLLPSPQRREGMGGESLSPRGRGGTGGRGSEKRLLLPSPQRREGLGGGSLSPRGRGGTGGRERKASAVPPPLLPLPSCLFPPASSLLPLPSSLVMPWYTARVSSRRIQIRHFCYST